MSLQRVRGILLFAVFVLSAYFCADIAMTIAGTVLTGRESGTGEVAPAAATGPKRMRSNVQYYSEPIVARNLFGEAAPNGGKPAGGSIDDVPTTSLEQKVTLVGTAVADSPLDSIAVMEDKSTRTQDIYCVADPKIERECNTAVDDAMVSSISRSCVIFLRAGKREKLCIPNPDMGKVPTRVASANPSAAAISPGGYAPPSDSIQKVDESTYRLDSQEVVKAMENLSSLFTQVRATPNFENGKTNGFRLYSIKRDSIFDKMGLRNGDVVRKINEYDLNSPEVALQLFSDLRSARDVTAEVVRGGRSQNLNYQVR